MNFPVCLLLFSWSTKHCAFLLNLSKDCFFFDHLLRIIRRKNILAELHLNVAQAERKYKIDFPGHLTTCEYILLHEFYCSRNVAVAMLLESLFVY